MITLARPMTIVPVPIEMSKYLCCCAKIHPLNVTSPLAIARPMIGNPAPEMDKLTNILNRFNELFGNIAWEDADNVRRQIAELPAMVAKDEVYQNAMKNSDKQNARLESERALNAVMFKIMRDNMELFKQFNDSPDFKKWLSDMVFDVTYDTSGNHTRIATAK